MTPVRLTVWSDYACPFCYLELPVLGRLREEFGERISIEWRAFELRPEPVPTLDPDGEYLHRVWGEAVYPMAEERGLTLRLPPIQPRSRRALEAAEAAREAGRFDAMHRALFRAFFEEGRDLADDEVLAEVGRAAELDPAALRAALADARHRKKIEADRALAERFGVAGVPAILVEAPDGRAGLISGAQPYETLSRAVAAALR